MEITDGGARDSLFSWADASESPSFNFNILKFCRTTSSTESHQSHSISLPLTGKHLAVVNVVWWWTIQRQRLYCMFSTTNAISHRWILWRFWWFCPLEMERRWTECVTSVSAQRRRRFSNTDGGVREFLVSWAEAFESPSFNFNILKFFCTTSSTLSLFNPIPFRFR
jgi:hypothetical protein